MARNVASRSKANGVDPETKRLEELAIVEPTPRIALAEAEQKPAAGILDFGARERDIQEIMEWANSVAGRESDRGQIMDMPAGENVNTSIKDILNVGPEEVKVVNEGESKAAGGKRSPAGNFNGSRAGKSGRKPASARKAAAKTRDPVMEARRRVAAAERDRDPIKEARQRIAMKAAASDSDDRRSRLLGRGAEGGSRKPAASLKQRAAARAGRMGLSEGSGGAYGKFKRVTGGSAAGGRAPSGKSARRPAGKPAGRPYAKAPLKEGRQPNIRKPRGNGEASVVDRRTPEGRGRRTGTQEYFRKIVAESARGMKGAPRKAPSRPEGRPAASQARRPGKPGSAAPQATRKAVSEGRGRPAKRMPPKQAGRAATRGREVLSEGASRGRSITAARGGVPKGAKRRVTSVNPRF